MDSAEDSKMVTAADVFLSRRVPHPGDDNLMDKFPLDLIEKLRENGLPFANLIFGDPHDKPIPEFARILALQGSRGLEENCSPKSFQYEWMYKNEAQAILSSLQRRRGDVYSRLTVDDVFVTNSAFGGLMMSMKTFSNVGDIFVTMAPEYFAYQPMIDGLECTRINVPLSESNDFALDVPKLEHTLLNTPKARILLLTSPNNPSGQMYDAEELQELATALHHVNKIRKQTHGLPPIIMISDEAYHRIIFPSTGRKYVSPAEFYEYTLSVYSYAKTCMAPSERLGWLALSPLWPDNTRHMTRNALIAARLSSGWLSPSVTNARCIPQLEEGDGVCVDMVKLQERRDKLVQACQQVFPQVITPSSGFYMLVRYPDNFYHPDRGLAFVNMMGYRYRILVLDGAFMGTPGWFRVSFTASDDMIDLAVSGIQKFATEYKAQEHELQRWIHGEVENTDKYTEDTT
jgi:aspartate aminotransferase